jgi:hypothetical protein
VFRTGEVDELMNKVSALSLRSNAVLVWNTIRIAEIIVSLEGTSGQAVAVADLSRVSPPHNAGLLVSGRYNFRPGDVARPVVGGLVLTATFRSQEPVPQIVVHSDHHESTLGGAKNSALSLLVFGGLACTQACAGPKGAGP